MDCLEQARTPANYPLARPHVLAATAGKGGVGKTQIAVNLAVALAQNDHQTMLLDADLGLGNVDIALGLAPDDDIYSVLTGSQSLESIILDGPAGVRVVPAASGETDLTRLSSVDHASITRAFSSVTEPVEFLIIDTAAGISHDVLAYGGAAQQVLVVARDEPASLVDAANLIQVLSEQEDVERFHIVANMVVAPEEGERVFRALLEASNGRLDIVLRYAGHIPQDTALQRAIRAQRSVVEAYPESSSAAAFQKLARYVAGWPPPEVSGGIEFFVERLIDPKRGS